MMKIEVVENLNPVSISKPGDLFIVFGGGKRNHESWYGSLLDNEQVSLRKQYYNLTIKSGFSGSDGLPWIVSEWEDDSRSLLERRWVANQLVEYIKSRPTPERLVFCLSAPYTFEQKVMVEDILSHWQDVFFQNIKIESCIVVTSKKDFNLLDRHSDVRFEMKNMYRSWVNENPDDLTSIEIGRRLKNFAKNYKCLFKSLDESEIKEAGMDLLLAVGQGATLSPSRMHIVHYKPDDLNVNKTHKPLLMVGKGITFDTGGLNVKAHERFVNTMKNDMAGAALVSSVFMALVRSGVEFPITLIIPSCANVIDQKSLKPGTIIKSYSGKNVIVDHTDAEGRLILADAISYAQDHFPPAKTLIAASLTTASMTQFSNFFTPVHFADSFFIKKLENSANRWGENFTFWQDFLPFTNANSSNAADLTNLGRTSGKSTGSAGSNVAAHFLKEFAREPIVHMDIFSSMWNWSDSYPGAHYGATGAPFNSLFDMLLESGKEWLNQP